MEVEKKKLGVTDNSRHTSIWQFYIRNTPQTFCFKKYFNQENGNLQNSQISSARREARHTSAERGHDRISRSATLINEKNEKACGLKKKAQRTTAIFDAIESIDIAWRSEIL